MSRPLRKLLLLRNRQVRYVVESARDDDDANVVLGLSIDGRIVESE